MSILNFNILYVLIVFYNFQICFNIYSYKFRSRIINNLTNLKNIDTFIKIKEIGLLPVRNLSLIIHKITKAH